MRITLRCDKCRGPVWLDFVDDRDGYNITDFCCLLCGKRWHVDNNAVVKFKQKVLNRNGYDASQRVILHKSGGRI